MSYSDVIAVFMCDAGEDIDNLAQSWLAALDTDVTS